MGKVKIPFNIRIASRNFKQYWNPHIWHDDKQFGSVNFRQGIIELEKSLCYDEKLLSMIHEWLHAINAVYKTNIDEENTERLASAIADLLKNELGMKFDFSDIRDLPENPEREVDWL